MANLNTLGQKVSSVYDKLQAKVLVETMDVIGETGTQSPGGGRVKGTSIDYADVPVQIAPVRMSDRVTTADKMISRQRYELTFPFYKDGTRLSVEASRHRLKVKARGDEPDKIFRIVAIQDFSGVYQTAVCEKE
jgi:hypothetical protein